MSQLSSSLKDKKKKKKKTKQSKIVCTRELDLSELIGISIDKVPNYLLDSNKAFEKTITPLLPTMTTSDLQEFRYVAILMHKIILLDIIHSLWITYRKSGMGDLPSMLQANHSNTNVWPTEVQSLIKQKQIQNINEDEACLMFVNNCLQKLNDKNQEYRKELHFRTSRLRNYTPRIQQTMEKYIEQ
jgi:hypothetical protein